MTEALGRGFFNRGRKRGQVSPIKNHQQLLGSGDRTHEELDIFMNNLPRVRNFYIPMQLSAQYGAAIAWTTSYQTIPSTWTYINLAKFAKGEDDKNDIVRVTMRLSAQTANATPAYNLKVKDGDGNDIASSEITLAGTVWASYSIEIDPDDFRNAAAGEWYLQIKKAAAGTNDIKITAPYLIVEFADLIV